MGNSESIIEDTLLGKSLINKCYVIKKPVRLMIRSKSKSNYIELWNDRAPNPCNPTVGSIGIKLPFGIKFKIIDVYKYKCMKNGTSLHIMGKILDNIYVDVLDQWIAKGKFFIDDRGKQHIISKWEKSTQNFDGLLEIKNKECEIDIVKFFPSTPWMHPIDFDIPRSHNVDYLKEINEDKVLENVR